ncbi:hypothetical protein AGABI2DRAFT_149310 [Agaricus bisporus var. bisporus H97]|uniref:hypothetical protein n=1 Tax=Agaricus bisporus var. bisporus (strain H97 / ATCC MYA-4626 / FGSC 10389) TaxID=936046 RepID=UPI00029F7C58|nr:hypothetical protein AGABI2DRAFT_149310 [Agaricus bisporus var. bisporus H97]EKV49007.1 hypothetical protein AGABI2DRAFT_149310 [Agaricus bisporus var. bisporus H97]
MVGKLLLQAIIAVSRQFFANFEKHQTTSLPHPGPLIPRWFEDTTRRDFLGMSKEQSDVTQKLSL